MSDLLKDITDKEFDVDVLQSTKLALVDFWAPWCGPCRAQTPTLEKVAELYSDKVLFCKLNVDDNPEVPTRYGVRGIPMLILFRDGQKLDEKVGMQSQQQLVDWLQSYL